MPRRADFWRRTYLRLAAYWPNASPEEQVVAEPLNTKPKYVVSTTLEQPLVWQNSMLLKGDVATAVGKLKEEDGGDLHVIGSTQLVHTLLDHDLVDVFRLMIDPLVLGNGKRIFGRGDRPRPLQLVESRVTTTGAILATYEAVRAS
ncbi:MAG: dihydrofolate reductase family protein [Actinomycetota bacterium]